MASVMDENGAVIPVTLLSASPNVITQVKNDETDGYTALQLGFEETKKINKPLAGHLKNSKIMPKIIREVRVSEITEGMKIGEKLSADLFSVGDKVDATGVSKGKGWAGTIKRHNFHRGRKTHGGQSYRRPGSIGSMYPQRIFPGKKMAGRMGSDQKTIKDLKIALVDMELNVIGVAGSVPGPRKAIVMLKEVK